MPERRRASQDADACQLPLREKRLKTQEHGTDSEPEDVVAQSEAFSTDRALRSHSKAHVPIELDSSASPHIQQDGYRNKSGKKSHVKFGNESIGLISPVVEVVKEEKSAITAEGEQEAQDDESDDDEAPEAISHLVAEAETKAAQAAEADLQRKRGQEEKDRRRKRDAQLKKQVISSSKRKNRAEKEDEEPEDEDNQPVETALKRPRLNLENLPTLLPEDLLATEAPTRLPTPPLIGTKASNAQNVMEPLVGKKKEEAPEDVIHAGKTIRVLQTTNKLLPPKANGKTRDLRDTWLQGRASFEKVDRRGSNISKFRRRAAPQAFV
jgi:U3 small nucleolar RNA-associated protein 16